MAAAFFMLLLLLPAIFPSGSHAITSSTQNAENDEAVIDYLKQLSIDELLLTEITSVSKKNERLTDAAAAVFVITAEDIRRTGARSIPELLRIVPGLQVARIDANKWAVTSRGFNNRFSNKLLVLMDGRSVYNPLFSGVYWNVQDTLLEDVDRIEVIRGPGAALWGANAVNGIVNIITKSSKETLGGLVTFGLGIHTDYNLGMRYGGTIGKDAAYRIYAKGFQQNAFEDESGNDFTDEWDAFRGGFRVDIGKNGRDDFSFQGSLYDGTADQRITTTGLLTPPFSITTKDTIYFSGGHVLGCWRHLFSNNSQTTMQLYYDRTDRKEGVFGETRDTVDIDFQHQWEVTSRQEIVWGLGYRFSKNDTNGTFTISVSPDSREDHLFSAFFQDTIELFSNRLWLTLGSKFEDNDYSGFEVQPSARIRWRYNPHITLWSAISRAVRTPSRADQDMRVNLASFPGNDGAVNVMAIVGTDDFDSEELTAFELGLRWHPCSWFSADIASFYNLYDRLRSIEPATPFFEALPSPPHLVFPLSIGNKIDGKTYGVEVLADLQALPQWKLSIGYTWFQVDLDLNAASGDRSALEYEGNSPDHQLQLRSYVNLPFRLEWDTMLFFVDQLNTFDVSEYWRLDTRIGWQAPHNVMVNLHFENILDDRHSEYGNQSGINASEMPRSVYLTLSYRL